MLKKYFAVIVVVLMLLVSAGAWAHSHDREDHKSATVRDEATRRGMNLLTEARANDIASRQIGTSNLYFKEVKLRNEAHDYPDGTNFRPVYKIECLSGHDEYELEIDAVTGKILKYELDD